MTDIPLLRITLAQTNPIVGDVEGNADKILAVYNDHKDKTDLIIFSELIISGYQPEDLVLHDAFINLCMETAYNLAKKTSGGPAMVISAPWMNNQKERQNCALFCHDGDIKSILPKHELPNYGVFDEVRVFDQGALQPPVDYMGYKLGIATCEDLWFPTVAKHLKDNGANVLISLNGSPFELEKDNKRKSIIKARAHETALPVIYVNQVGGQDEIVYDGGSFAMNADGELIHQLPFFQSATQTISLPLGREQRSTVTEGHAMLSERGQYGNNPHPSPLPEGRGDNNFLVYECLKLGLHDYVTKNGFPGVLLGLSGGIDSALSAVIAVDALGADKVHCVMMPSPCTSQESLDDAKSLAENLGCQYDIMDIQPAMDAYHKMIPDMNGVALENIQSRARGMALMAMSNTHGHMVLSTGNKSEMAVGYATLYGDMCGGYNVLKDVYKTEVFELSRWRNDQEFVMPENIITRPPSAELRPDQKDEDSLPDYDILDAILESLIEKRKSTSQIISEGFDAKTVHMIRLWLDRAEYKRRQAPPGVKITKNSFGRERRMPITNKYQNA